MRAKGGSITLGDLNMRFVLDYWPYLVAILALGIAYVLSRRRHDWLAAGVALAACVLAYVAYDAASLRSDALAYGPNSNEIAALRKRVTGLEGENRTAVVANDDLKRDQARTLDKIAVTLEQVDPARDGSAQLARGLDSRARIDVETERLFRLLRTRREQVNTAGDDVADLVRLRDKIGVKLDTPNYSMEAFPDNEVIKKKQGRYYVVELKDANRGIRYYFEKGKYTLDRRSEEFRSSLNVFVGDILSRINGKANYELMVRGTADSLPYTGKFEPGFEFTNVRYLKSIGGDRYEDVLSDHPVSPVLRNEDLPLLRSAYLQKIIADAYPVKPPLVLEGTVSRQVAEKDRNAELLLFVSW